MQHTIKTTLLTLVTLTIAGCAHSDSGGKKQAAWNPAGAPQKNPRGGQTRPPKILPNTHYAAGRLFEQQGATDKAIDQYRRAVALNHNFAEAYHRLGVLLSVTGQRNESVEMLRRAAGINPASAVVHNDLGFELMFQNDLNAAEREFRKAIELTPTYARAHINLGLVLCRQKRFDDAYLAFRNVLPEPDAHYNVGLMLRGQQNYTEAVRAFQRTLEADPKFTAAQNQLAQLQQRQSSGGASSSGVIQQVRAGDGEPVETLPAFMGEGFGTFDVTPNSAHAQAMEVPELLARPSAQQVQSTRGDVNYSMGAPGIACAPSFHPAMLLMSYNNAESSWSDPCEKQLAFEQWLQEESLITEMSPMSAFTSRAGHPEPADKLVVSFEQWQAIRTELQRETRAGQRIGTGYPSRGPAGRANTLLQTTSTGQRTTDVYPPLPPFNPYAPAYTERPFDVSVNAYTNMYGPEDARAQSRTTARGTMAAGIMPDNAGNHLSSRPEAPTGRPFGWIEDVDDVHDALSIVRNEIACWDAVIDGAFWNERSAGSGDRTGAPVDDQSTWGDVQGPTGSQPNFSTLPTFTPAPPEYIEKASTSSGNRK